MLPLSLVPMGHCGVILEPYLDLVPDHSHTLPGLLGDGKILLKLLELTSGIWLALVLLLTAKSVPSLR